jgi:hypothetical protein
MILLLLLIPILGGMFMAGLYEMAQDSKRNRLLKEQNQLLREQNELLRKKN